MSSFVDIRKSVTLINIRTSDVTGVTETGNPSSTFWWRHLEI